MAAMTTVLTEFSQNGNSRTSTTTGHTAIKPKLVIEKRRVPEGNQTMCEYSFKIVHATEDSNGEVLDQKPSIEVIARYPKLGTYSDVTAEAAILLDIVGSDEFAASLASQNWLS